jgi:hypothetical protein
MRLFYLAWPPERISQTPSAKSAPHPGFADGVWRIVRTRSARSTDPAISAALGTLAQAFPLPWSAYVRLLSVKSEAARAFYEVEALRCGWSVRQLDRQVNSQFYERIALSRNKAAMLAKGEVAAPATPSRPSRPSRTPSCWSSLTSRTSIPNPISKKL